MCASTRTTVAFFFIASSSASIVFPPSAYLVAYLVNAFFFDL